MNQVAIAGASCCYVWYTWQKGDIQTANFYKPVGDDILQQVWEIRQAPVCTLNHCVGSHYWLPSLSAYTPTQTRQCNAWVLGPEDVCQFRERQLTNTESFGNAMRTVGMLFLKDFFFFPCPVRSSLFCQLHVQFRQLCPSIAPVFVIVHCREGP